MNAPLKPGSVWQTWTIQQVLSWGQGGGLYRVTDGPETRLLKELILPPARIDQVVLAATGWQKLERPQAIPLEDVRQMDGRVYLLMPELSGQPVSLEARTRTTPPSEAVLLKWAQQICDLVLALQQQHNHLALALLEPDHILVDAQGDLVVFNPGWSQLPGDTTGLHKFARLMVFCATGAPMVGDKPPPDLPPAFLWMVSRCLQDEYTSFSQLHQSLQKVAVEETRSPRSRQQSLDEFSVQDLPIAPPARPLSRRLLLGLGLLSLLALLGLGLALRRGQSKYSQRPGLAVARENRLVWLSPEGTTVGESQLPQAITCMLASLDGDLLVLGIEGQNGITVVDRAKRQSLKIEGGSIPTQLLLSSDGQQVVGLFKNGNLGHWKLANGAIHWLGEVPWAGFALGARLAAVRDDGGALLILPGRGLVLVDSQGSEEGVFAGATTALFLNQLVVAADSRQGILLALDSELQPIARQKFVGLTQLYANSYQRGVWGVEQRGTVTLWSVPELLPLGQLTLPGKPLCVTSDPLGHLWTVTQSGKLCKLDSHPLSCQQLGQVGACTALVYLAQPLTVKPSQI